MALLMRFALLVVGFGASYVLVYLGDFLGSTTLTAVYSGSYSLGTLLILVLISIVSICGASYAALHNVVPCYHAMIDSAVGEDSFGFLLAATYGVLSTSFLFGLLGNPSHFYGLLPWNWHTFWSLLPIVGIFPMVAAAGDWVVDLLILFRRGRKQEGSVSKPR